MEKSSKIYVAGHTGLVGSNLVKKLIEFGYTDIVYATHKELDLRDYHKVNNFFDFHMPDMVFLCAATVGGINANNKFPVDFIMNNIRIENNIIEACFSHDVEKLLFLGSSCIYPKNAEQPIKEESLMTGQLEPTNSAYAISKISGIEMCRAYNKQYRTNYICAMPPNIMGVGDSFDLITCHVLAALIRKIYTAKINNKDTIELWGTGNPLREFLYAEDLAEGLVFLMNNYNATPTDNLINIGSGEEISINDLAEMIKNIVEYNGNIIYNSSMPDGTPRKLLDNSKINSLGWKNRFSLEEGIKKTFEYYTSII